jgi:hypothetical protein
MRNEKIVRKRGISHRLRSGYQLGNRARFCEAGSEAGTGDKDCLARRGSQKGD